MSTMYVPPHLIINTPKSILIARAGIRKRETAIARILGITKYANAVLKFEKEEHPNNLWGCCLGRPRAGLGPTWSSLDCINDKRLRWNLVPNKNNTYYRPIPHLLRDWGFNRNWRNCQDIMCISQATLHSNPTPHASQQVWTAIRVPPWCNI